MRSLIILPFVLMLGCSTPCYEVCDFLFAKAESCLEDFPNRQGTINNKFNREVCARFFGAVNEIMNGKDAECMDTLANPGDVDCTNVMPLLEDLLPPDSNTDGSTDG